jgi:hypothetical protein
MTISLTDLVQPGAKHDDAPHWRPGTRRAQRDPHYMAECEQQAGAQRQQHQRDGQSQHRKSIGSDNDATRIFDITAVFHADKS